MKIIGIDLSGPSNTVDTVCVMFDAQGGCLRLADCICDATDQDIVALLTTLNRAESVIVGLDAPLSYNPGGGDRPSDKDLRRTIVGAGLHPGSVMPPTMTKMAYLTLRGMGVARLITTVGWEMIRVVEVHPGATMALGGAAIDAVKALKSDSVARQDLLAWMEGGGIAGDRPKASVRSLCRGLCLCVGCLEMVA